MNPRRNQAGIVFRLGDRLRAFQGQEPLGAAPNEAVAALAILLAQSRGSGCPRSVLGQRLYPESDFVTARVALRQSLSRLKAWLGPESVAAGKNEIVPNGTWELIVEETSSLIRRYSRPQIVELYGSDATDVVDPERPELERLVEAIRLVAKHDSDSARAMFINTQSLLTCVLPRYREELLGLTRPKSRRDPFAFEHCEAIANLNNVRGIQHESIPWLLRAYRIAKHVGSRVLIARAMAHLLFVHLETGSRTESTRIMTELNQEFRQHRVLVDNARIAFFWNFGEFGLARQMLLDCMRSVESGSRTDQLHFWVNATVFSAEIGDATLFEQAHSRACELLLPQFDDESRISLAYAEAKMLCWSDPYEAVKTLTPLSSQCRETGRNCYGYYIDEVLALAHSAFGDVRNAKLVWSRVQTIRTQPGWRLNPRHLLLRRAVMSGDVRPPLPAQ